MWKVLASLLRALAERAYPSPSVNVADPYLPATRALVEKWEKALPNDFWEAKRKQVLVALKEKFPEAHRRDLSLAVELVIQERK